MESDTGIHGEPAPVSLQNLMEVLLSEDLKIYTLDCV